MSWVAVATKATTATSVNLVGDLLVPLIVGLVGGSVGAVLVAQVFASADSRRDNYAEAVAVLLSWSEFPFMIRRRVDDLPATLQHLADHGHEFQERLARSEAWVAAESKAMGAKYTTLISEVKAAIGPLLKEAWESPPIAAAAEMNLNGWGAKASSGVRQQINEFRGQTPLRFGWRRILPLNS